MNLLADTHVLLWLLNGDERLPAKVIGDLLSEENDVFVSAVSLFEMATKIRIGKLVVPPRFRSALTLIFQDYSYKPLHLSPDHAERAGRLPGEHRDPFDRLLAAQAISEDMAVVTIDRRIGDLGAKVLW